MTLNYKKDHHLEALINCKIDNLDVDNAIIIKPEVQFLRVRVGYAKNNDGQFQPEKDKLKQAKRSEWCTEDGEPYVYMYPLFKGGEPQLKFIHYRPNGKEFDKSF